MKYRGPALLAACTLVIGTIWRIVTSFGRRNDGRPAHNCTSEPQQPENKQKEKSGSQIPLPAVVAVITALIANIGVIFGLLSGYIPGLRPDIPPPDLKAEISNLELEHSYVGVEDYLLDEPYDKPEITVTDDQEIGHVVSFDMDLNGLENDPVVVKWTMYDAQSRELFPRVLDLTSRTAYDSIIPRSESTHVRLRVWVPIPTVDEPGPIGFRVDVYDQEGGGRLASYKRDDLPLLPSSSS